MLFRVCSTYAQVIPRNVLLLYEHTKKPTRHTQTIPSILVAPDKFSMFRWHFRRSVEAWSSLRPVQSTLVTRLPSMVLLNLLCSVCVCVVFVSIVSYPNPGARLAGCLEQEKVSPAVLCTGASPKMLRAHSNRLGSFVVAVRKGWSAPSGKFRKHYHINTGDRRVCVEWWYSLEKWL